MTEQLKPLPCPACGCDWYSVHSEFEDEGDEDFYVICPTCDMRGPLRKSEVQAISAWNYLPRATKWTTNPPALGEWNWWRIDTDSQPICRYVYSDGTIDNQMIGRIAWQDICGQWCPIPTPKEDYPRQQGL